MSTLSVISSRSVPGSEAALAHRLFDLVDELGSREQLRRDVHRQLERPAEHLLPRRHLMARLAQHLIGERDDEAGLFGDGDELRRRHHAAIRALPAHQRLQPADARRRQLHDRLIEDRELVALDRAAQLGLERQALQRGGVHVRVEQLVAAAARGLGAIHRDVRVAKQGIDRLRYGECRRRCRCWPTPRTFCLSIWNGSASASCSRSAMRADVLGRRDVLGEHGELVAAEPRQHVARAQLRLQPPGDGDQESVADHVAEAVVDQLEAVEVDEQHGVAGRRDARRLRNRALEQLAEQRAVRAARSAHRAARPAPASPGCGAAR